MDGGDLSFLGDGMSYVMQVSIVEGCGGPRTVVLELSSEGAPESWFSSHWLLEVVMVIGELL